MSNSNIIGMILGKIKRAEDINFIVSNNLNHTERTFTCSNCGKLFIIDTYKLIKLVTDIYTNKLTNNIDVYCCDECKTQHLEKLSKSFQPKGPKWVRCFKCGKEYKLTKLEYKKMVKSINLGYEVNPSQFICDECSKYDNQDLDFKMSEINKLLNEKLNNKSSQSKQLIKSRYNIEELELMSDIYDKKLIINTKDKIREFNHNKFKNIYKYFTENVIPTFGNMVMVFKQLDSKALNFISESNGEFFMIDKMALLDLLYNCYNINSFKPLIKSQVFKYGVQSTYDTLLNNVNNNISKSDYFDINFSGIICKNNGRYVKMLNPEMQVKNKKQKSKLIKLSNSLASSILYNINKKKDNKNRNINISLDEKDLISVNTDKQDEIVITINLR